MPWEPLPRIAFAVATYPFAAASAADLPLELGDELYIIERGGTDGQWFRGYLVAPPSLLAGLTSSKGQTLEARVFSGIFPASCVEVREVLGEDGESAEEENELGVVVNGEREGDHGEVVEEGSPSESAASSKPQKSKSKKGLTNSIIAPALRDPEAPKPPAPVPMLKIGDETPTSFEEPLVDEIASCLREWHSKNLHELLLSRQYPLLEKMSTLVQSLDASRRKLLHNILTTHELELLREQTVWDLVRGNELLNGEIIVRDPAQRGRILTGDDSAVEITTLQSMMSLLDEKPQSSTPETTTLHHLLIDVKAFVGTSTEPTTLVFFLATKSSGEAAKPLTESYVVDVPQNGSLTSIAKIENVRTLFTELGAGDIGDLPSSDTELFLVVKVRTTQQIVVGRPGSRSNSRDDTSRNGELPTNGISKAGRRSLMWGQKPQRTASSKTAFTRLGSLSEQGGSRADERPPGTAASKATDSKVGTISRNVTRTIGIGALKLNSIMKQDEEVEQLVPIWTPSTGFNDQQDQGDGWEDVIRDLMPSKSSHHERSRKEERLQIQLKAFENSDADTLIKLTPTLLAEVPRTNKMGFSGAPTKPRSDIYLTIDEAFLPRNALLSRTSGSATPISSNLTGANLQITLEVRRANGDRIENCIFASSVADATSEWESTSSQRGDAWNETIRLSIPPADVPGSHIVMMLADVPNQPFAMCYMPLWDQQAFMRDGYHSLLLYRYDESTAVPKGNQGRGGYLGLGWNARGKDDVSKDEAVTGPVAVLRLQTYLCSTRFSQDKVLLGLLRWKEQPPGAVQELLKRLVFVPEIEIVKLLSDVFDAIFGILVENSGNDDFEDMVFSALITVLGITHDRRFNLEPLVDHYAEKRFNYPFATPCLVRSFTRLLAKPSDPETSRNLRATFKVVRHILKFITHARGQQKEKEAGIGITSTSSGFNRDLRAIFKALDGLMRDTAPILVGSQTLAVQHFHTWLPELTGLLEPEEILHVAIDFMDSCALVKGKLILYKLVLIINYSRLDLFSLPDQKAALSANTVRWIEPHWGKADEVNDQWKDQVRLCCSILATQVDCLGPEVPDYIPKIIDSYLAIQAAPRSTKTALSFLFPTTYPFPSKAINSEARFDEVLVELSAILSSLSSLPAGMQLDLAGDEMALVIEDILRVHQSILQCQAFPSSWLSVHIYHHKSTMRTLEYIAGILLEQFLPHPDQAEDYNTGLWKAFFTVLLMLVGSDALALETFSEQKRRAVWKIAGDVREHGAELLRRTWEAIGWDTSPDELQQYSLVRMGGYQVQYVPALVGPIIELCLSVHEGLRKVAVDVLQSMIVSEWTLSEDLGVIQTEMIYNLDQFFKTKPLTESILQKIFIKELMVLFGGLSEFPDDPLFAALKELIATIDEYLDLLVAVHSTDVTGEASHMIHRLRLMEFLRDMQKEDIFIRYVHQLADLQEKARNHTAAGLALRLHADLYEWDPMKIVLALSEPEFPAQSHFDRKERIYFEMIKQYEEGESWSSALQAYQELQFQYQENVFDFPKLARTQRSIATIYETISKSDKLVPKYFRVIYKGMGFPPSLRDKEFVFEGSPNERTSSFTDRMQEQHPAAQISTTSGDIPDVEGQFLVVSSLSPHRDLDSHVFQRARVPQVVRDYILSAQPSLFSVTSKRNTSGPVREHSAEKIVYETAEAFPTVLRRSEIVKVSHVKLDPLQTALERVLRKTQEIVVVEKRVLDGEDDMAPLLIEALSISVNPTTDSSVARYRELLDHENDDDYDEEEERMNPREPTPLENALKVALHDHTILIKRCLAYFSKAATNFQGVMRESREELQHSTHSFTLQRHLIPVLAKSISDFEQTFAPELASLSVPQPAQREPTPTPTPSWAVGSPSSERTSLFGLTIPNSVTNGTIMTTDTSILNSPVHHRAGSRLSFLKRPPQPDLDPKEGAQVNGRGRKKSHGSSEGGDAHEQKKENRRSFFGGGGGTSTSTSLGKGLASSEKEDDAEWVTSSDLTLSSGGIGGNEMIAVPRRSSSSNRGVGGSESNAPSTSVGSRVGSVRKRLSMLKLGKKASKASVLVDSVAEEE